MKRLAVLALLALAQPAAAASVDEGRYQAVLGDCTACHGANLAGGVALETPFGKLLTPNITPDRETGIGNYSAADFRAAMKRGMAPGGKRLYPAMPYPSYARMRDADVDALWAWLQTVKPVRKAVDVNQLRFPFNLRITMWGWNLLFFRPMEFAEDKTQNAAWNRGAYLVQGAGHCGTCHSPKNWFGAERGKPLSGASLQGWWAPDLGGGKATGLGGWSAGDITTYLATGRTARSTASGPMAEVVAHSTSRMRADDLSAIAVYLKALPDSGLSPGSSDGARMASGARLYAVNCAACHGFDGAGDKVLFPALAGNTLVTQRSAETLVRAVLAGSKGAVTAKAPTGAAMPSFAWKLDDTQVADVLSYVRGNWGNRAAPVNPDAVRRQRESLQARR